MSDIPSWAVRGSRVVCVIEDGWAAARSKIVDPEEEMTFPVRGLIYTIREVRVRYVPEWNEVLVGVLVEEVVNPIASGGSAGGEEPSWDIRAFAPVRTARQRAQAEVPELVS
jgi:hypothetical protein